MVALWFVIPFCGLVAVSATTAATAVTTATTSARLAGLGFIYGESPAPMVLAVQGRNRRLGFRIGVHLHESEPLAPTGRPVSDDFRAQHRSVRGQHRLQV